MSTTEAQYTISSALFGKTRRQVLGLLYGQAERSFYLREIARNTEAGLGAVQRELSRLWASGIILRIVRGRQVFYQANPRCPVFAEVKALVLKTSGVADLLRGALAPLASQITVAFIYGSMAKGTPTVDSDVDVIIVGDVTFAQAVAALAPVQDKLGREINPTVYPRAEFSAKVAGGHHFVSTVLRESKLFLIGDDDELARLAKSRLAGRAQAQPARDCRPTRSRRS